MKNLAFNRFEKILIILCLFITSIIISCTKDSTSEPELPPQITYQEVVRTVLQPQENYFNIYKDLLALTDSISALDSVLNLFKKNPDVLWAEKSINGIDVQYKNGIRGGIVTTDSYLSKAVNSNENLQSDDNKRTLQKTLTNITPLSKKSVIISQFGVELEIIEEAFYQYLPSIGFEQPVVYRGIIHPDDIEIFKNLQNYGVIYINSGGFPWTINNPEECYILTKIPLQESVFLKYITDFLAGNLMTKFHLLFGNIVLIGSNFISTYNNFELSKPLIIGSYSFSIFSELASKMKSNTKGAFIGYDWFEPNNSDDLIWINDLIFSMTQEPINIKQWMVGPFLKFFPAYKHPTNIKFIGPDNFGLYNGPDWPWRYVNINLDYVDGLCSLSTGGTYLWEDLFFGHPYQYVSISPDGKTFTAQWDSTYDSNARQRGELSIEVDTTNLMVTNFNAYYTYETYDGDKIFHYQRMEIQGHNIPMAYKADTYLVNETKGTAVCDAVNYFTFVYIDNVGTQNERTTTLTSYTCDANSWVTIHWYKDKY